MTSSLEGKGETAEGVAGERGGPDIQGAPTPSMEPSPKAWAPSLISYDNHHHSDGVFPGMEISTKRVSRALGWATPGGAVTLGTTPAVLIAARGPGVVMLLVTLLALAIAVGSTLAAPFAPLACWGGPACCRCLLTVTAVLVPRALQSSGPLIYWGTEEVGHFSDKNRFRSDVPPEAAVLVNGEVRAVRRRQLGSA